MLQRLGYRVAGFTDANEALAAFRSNPAAYEAVVTDLSMPSMSGIEFASHVLQLRPEVPVVMTSGYVRAKDRESVMKTGVRDLLLKPNTVEELGDVLHRLMAQTQGFLSRHHRVEDHEAVAARLLRLVERFVRLAI